MDFVKLKELPKPSAVVREDSDSQRFKAFKKRCEQSCGIDSDIKAMCFPTHSDTSQLSVACGTKVTLFDVGFSTVSESSNWSKHKNIVNCLAYRKDGKLLIAGDADGSANIYDVSVTKGIIRRLRGHDGAIYTATFCGDSTRVATGGQDQSVKIWDVPTGQVHLNLTGHNDSIRALVPVGENGLISAGSDGKIIQWDIRGSTGDKVSEVSHGSPIEQLSLFDSGALMFSIGGGTVRLWDVKSMTEVREASSVKHTKPVTGAVVSSCGDFLATSSFDMTVKITRISTWEVVTSFTSPHAITALAWRGNSLVYGTEKGAWILRQRRAGDEKAPEVNEADQVDLLKTDDARYYRTVTLTNNSNKALHLNTKESNPDFLFRKFEYRKLIDFLIDSTPHPPLALAIVDELIQRGGLLASLRNRPTDELTKIIQWCDRLLVADPRCSFRLVRQVLETVVEANMRAFANPDGNTQALDKAIKNLHMKLGQEVSLQLRASALAGLIESVVSS